MQLLLSSSLRSPLLRVFLPAALGAMVVGCAGGSGNGTGTAGTTGSAGSSSAGTQGAGTAGTGGQTAGAAGTGGQTAGTAGTTGQAGSGAGTAGGGTSGGGTTGQAGSAAGTTGTGTGGRGGGAGSATAGATGSGGQAGGAAGSSAAGTSGGFTPYVCPSGMSAPAASAFPAGSTSMQVSGAPPIDNFDGNQGNGFTNVEGPVWIGNALYFSEMTSGNNPPPSRILKIDSSNAVTQFYPSGSGGDSGSNGMAVDASGNLVTANHGVGGIVSYTVPGAVKTTLISMYNGKRFNSPNDLTIRNDGTIYFTDPTFQAPGNPQPNTGVYMLKPGASTATEIISTLSNPNGITLSLDEKALYVGHGGGVNVYAVNMDGTIGATPTMVDGANLNNNATDGMAIDCAGDLYVVRVNTHDIDVVSFGGNAGSYNPNSAGTHLTTITGITSAQLTNAAFGGADHKTLFVTAQGTKPTKGVYKLTMPIPGMPY